MRIPLWLSFILVASIVRVSADTFVVTNTNNSGPGSLRQAITDANAHPNPANGDDVRFNLPGSGVHTITVTSALPDITEAVVVDGWSQPGFQITPVIELKSGAGLAADGVRVTSTFSTIRGLVVNGFQTGIYVSGSLNNIQGCFIGTDQSGTQVAPNDRGIVIAGGSRNLIGGGGIGAGNLISGNRQTGISFVHSISPIYGTDVRPDRNIVQGNLIGTDRTGASALPNGGDGVAFLSGGGISNYGATSNRIGGTTSRARNVISGNFGNGIQIAQQAILTLIQGNFIGTAADGLTPMGNGKNGILLDNAVATLVGAVFDGPRLDAANVIAFNPLNGICVRNQTQNERFSANLIHDNGTLGIDLGDDGVSPNDPGDGDTGPNGLQNFPFISAAFASNGSLIIYGNLNSTASKDYVLEFFANSIADSSGFGEGQVFLGQAPVTTDSSGNVAFNVTFPLQANLANVTATATDSENTSEFSAAVTIAATTPTAPPTSPTAVNAAVRPNQLLNLSTRLRVETGQGVLIGGFIVSGTQPKKIIVRGIGPSMAVFNVPGLLADPILELYDSSGQLLAQNDNWRQNQEAEIQNSGLAPGNDLESAIVRTVPPGNYTAIVRGKNDTAGTALVEVYDLSQATASYLGNVSARGFVDTGDNVMISGFIAAGSGGGPTTVAIRGLGPSLASFGITNYLADPTIELRNANGTRVQSNNEWMDDQGFDDIRASGLAPQNVHESMIVFDVTPGSYTTILRGTSNGTGVGVLEIYNLR